MYVGYIMSASRPLLPIQIQIYCILLVNSPLPLLCDNTSMAGVALQRFGILSTKWHLPECFCLLVQIMKLIREDNNLNQCTRPLQACNIEHQQKHVITPACSLESWHGSMLCLCGTLSIPQITLVRRSFRRWRRVCSEVPETRRIGWSEWSMS
jgi:hypothetical protein